MKTLARPGDRDELRRRLRCLAPDTPRKWGKMSAPEMVCHLNDSCRMALGQKPVVDVSTILQRTAVKWIALYLPMRWPPGLLTRPEIEQGIGGTCPGDFAADLAEQDALLGSLASRRDGWPVHPIFGRMSTRAWLRWGYLHTDHHLRQFGR